MEYPIFIENIKDRFEKLLNPKTHWIHFDGEEGVVNFKIPMLENLSYVLTLLHSHKKECVQVAFERLERLLKFYVPKEGFPDNLHDFPEVKNHNKQILILFILMRLEKQYGKYCKDELLAVLQNTLDDFKEALSKKLKNSIHLQKFNAITEKSEDFSFSSIEDYAEFLLIKGPSIDSLRYYDLWTNTICDHSIQKRDGFSEEYTLYHFLADFCLDNLDKKIIPFSLLYAAPLFMQEWKMQNYGIVEKRQTIVQKNSGIQINFPNDYSLYIHTDHMMEIEEKDGVFNIDISYPNESLDERESLIETEIFCTKKPQFQIFADEQKVTTFSLDDKVVIKDKRNHIIGNIEIKSDRGCFLGTMYFGNRPNQKKKGFETFDQVIGVRTVHRKENAKIKICIHWDVNWISE